MSQLEADASTLDGDPVETPADAIETPENTDTTLEDMYPEDGQREEPEEDRDPYEDEDPNVDDQADDGEEGDDNDDMDEDDEPEEPAIEPPHSWKAEEKERWNNLPRETQAYLSEREAERERFVNSKAQEAAQAKETVTRQAEAELAQFSEQQAAQYQMLAQQFFPQEPDDRLLYTGNPQDQLKYQQQQAEYRRGMAQQQQLQQAAQEHAQRAQRIRDDQETAARQQDIERLQSEMPELFDETKQADLQTNLTATAKALGYPDELLPEANSADFLALRTASQWKEKADKWDQYQKAKMGSVRAAKKKVPVPNKPGNVVTGKPASSDPIKLLYPND